jgi:hypothetical protein
VRILLVEDEPHAARMLAKSCAAMSNVIEVMIQRLRRELDLPGRSSIIQTRRGHGDLLTAADARRGERS